MDITFVTNTNSDTDSLALLKELGLPFKTNDDAEKEREVQIEKAKEEQRKEAEEQAKMDDSNEENNISDSQELEIEENNQDLEEGSNKIES